MPFDSPVCELSEQGQKVDLEVTDGVVGHVKGKMLDFSAWYLMNLAVGMQNISMKHD